jgi:ubiquinone/menaquinone biosynthesis C-methylase UbiE
MTKNPSVTDFYNDAASSYARSRIGKEYTQEIHKFCDLLKPGANVLDVGCAAGRDSHILSSLGCSVTGVDVADKLLEIASTSYPDVTFINADMRKLPFTDGKFDGIWASAVLHHVPKKEVGKVLAEFNRVLSAHGILYVQTKSKLGIAPTSEPAEHDERIDFTLLSVDEVSEALAKGGFSVIDMRVQPSKSRQGLEWLVAFCHKSSRVRRIN